MSIMKRLLRRLAAWAGPHQPSRPDPDTMAFRQWTDLPTHHPLCKGPRNPVA
jgi:hypothetical protein